MTVGPPNQLQGHLVLLMGLGHREQLVGRRVLGIAGHFVEMTGGCALATVNTGLQVGCEVAAVERQELVGAAGAGLVVSLFVLYEHSDRRERRSSHFTCTSSSPSGSITCTAQAMQGSKLWMVRWISSGWSGMASWWLSISAAS